MSEADLSFMSAQSFVDVASYEEGTVGHTICLAVDTEIGYLQNVIALEETAAEKIEEDRRRNAIYARISQMKKEIRFLRKIKYNLLIEAQNAVILDFQGGERFYRWLHDRITELENGNDCTGSAIDAVRSSWRIYMGSLLQE